MIKPDFWNDEKLGVESESVQLTYIGTWTFSDDYGVVKGNPVWLKSQIFPYKQSLRIEVFSKWLEALEAQDLIIPFALRGERFYFIRNFRLHQSVDKPSKTRNCTEEELISVLKSSGWNLQQDNSCVRLDDYSNSTRVPLEDEEKRSIREVKSIRESNDSLADKSAVNGFHKEQNELRKEFKALDIPDDVREAWSFIKNWIDEKKPDFIEPYVLAWNAFAAYYKFPSVKQINPTRRKKFATRISEPGFDFFAILAIVKKSEFLRNGDWFGFDWIIQNDSNYLKILEKPDGWN